MANPDLPPSPPNHKDDENVPAGLAYANSSGTESKPGNCLVTDETAKSTHPVSGNDTELTNKRKRGPPDASNEDNAEKISTEVVDTTRPVSGNYTESTNKRKRGPPDASNDDNEEKISTEVVDTTDTVEIAGVKEVEMKDAEAIDESSNHQGIKEVEMQDAEVMYNRTTHVKENKGVADVDSEDSKMHPPAESNLNATKGCKQDEGTKEAEADQPKKVDESESSEKRSIVADAINGSRLQALGEVATLLKQVQESDAKAKLEVEVKVKKMDDGVVKENGEKEKQQSAATQVSCQ